MDSAAEGWERPDGRDWLEPQDKRLPPPGASVPKRATPPAVVMAGPLHFFRTPDHLQSGGVDRVTA
jgi:hypothetical protein